VPIRHFASTRSKLGVAVQSGDFFTDMHAAMREWQLIIHGATEISVLFDSTLPGRENIIKGNAKKGMSDIKQTMALQEHAHAQIPAIRRPDVSGFSLFFGMKMIKTQYPRSINVVTWRKFFTKPGAFLELSGPTFERNVVAFGQNNFEAMTFRSWNLMAIDGP
jgi:hypothetical protein